MDNRKSLILDALRAFIARRPGLEFGNYGDVKAYRSEMRSITKDRHEAETLLRAVSGHDSITADDLAKAAESAYSGRLVITETRGGSITIDYCTGQYFSTEYRRAVCAVLASALWTWTRENAMPPIDGYAVREWGNRTKNYGVFASRKAADTELKRLTHAFANPSNSSWGTVDEVYGLVNMTAGDWLRAHFAREFGRTIGKRWFS